MKAIEGLRGTNPFAELDVHIFSCLWGVLGEMAVPVAMLWCAVAQDMYAPTLLCDPGEREIL